MSDKVDLGGLISDAAESNDATVAASIIRSGDFIVFQQIDAENSEVEEGEIEKDADSFSVVLAEIDDETAVVCFSNQDSASNFANELAQDIPPGRELPAIVLDGNTLLDGLPQDCGLLVNPGAETECYFPPGCLNTP